MWHNGIKSKECISRAKKNVWICYLKNTTSTLHYIRQFFIKEEHLVFSSQYAKSE
jgi:hypothetical protein